MRAFTAAIDLRRYVGRWSLRSASHAGRFFFMVLDLVRGILEWRVWVPRTIEQTMSVGYGSLFIVLLVAGFAGAVTSLQAGYQFTGQLPLYVAGGIISESMILELGGIARADPAGQDEAREYGTQLQDHRFDDDPTGHVEGQLPGELVPCLERGHCARKPGHEQHDE
ncbi:MAG: hypothetical protein DMD64_10670, partial [Gemmatimonadetes bacterium]